MNKGWTVGTLRKKKVLIEKRLPYATVAEKAKYLDDIQTLEYVIYSLTHNDKGEMITPPLKEIINDELELLKPYRFLWADLIKYGNILKNYPISSKYNSDIKANLTDIYNFINDFYASTNNYFYNYFAREFKNRDKYIRLAVLPEFSGQAFHLQTFKETFIEANYTQSFNVVSTLIHEYGHAIHFNINYPLQSFDIMIPYHELLSLFFELISYDYAKNTNFYPEAANLTKINSIAYDINNFYFFRTELLILKLKQQNISIPNLKNEAKRRYGIEKNDFNNIFQMLGSDKISYMASMMLAIELLYLYRQDKDNALWILKNIATYDKLNPRKLYKYILEMGIKPNENVENFYKSLVKKL